MVKRLPWSSRGWHRRAVYPHDLSQFITEFFRKKGVKIWSGELPVDVNASQGKNLLKTKKRQGTIGDGVVAGIGIQPNLELPKRSACK